MRSIGGGKAIAIAAGIALLIGVGLALHAHRGAPRHTKSEEAWRDVTAQRRELAREQKRLGDLLARSRAALDTPRRDPPAAAGAGAAALSAAERAALGDAVDRMYDPNEILKVLEDPAPGAVRDYVAKVDERYKAFEDPASLAGPDGDVPISPGLREAIGRVSALKSYTQNLMHARQPAAPDRQWLTVRKIDDSFRARFEALNAAYPFLDLRMVEAP
jgi:hypothetical protein